MLKNIKERLASPLFFSFILSWIIFNWEVTVALLWYDPEPKSLGHESLIKYIRDNTNKEFSFIIPICFAIGYTLLNPIIKNLISAFRTWNSKWGGDWNLRILKGSKVPIDKHLAFRKNYDKRTKVLEDVITNESVTQKRIEETTTALFEEQNQKGKLMNELSYARDLVDNFTNLTVLEGNWIKVTERVLSDDSLTEKFRIMQGSVYIENEQIFIIQSFAYNKRNRNLSFVLWHIKDSKFYSFIDVSFSHNDLEGFEYRLDSRSKVVFKRPNEDLR